MVPRETVLGALETYGKAWVEQDPLLILTIFTPDATYRERVFENPFRGHDEIKRYWQEKVVEEQSNISFALLNTYIDGDTAIAEWEASFTDPDGKKRIREVAILEFEGNRIKSLREYWQKAPPKNT